MELEHSLPQKTQLPVDGEQSCCDLAESGGQKNCHHAIQCGSCPSTTFGVFTSSNTAPGRADKLSWAPIVDQLSISYSFPLFRPPIS